MRNDNALLFSDENYRSTKMSSDVDAGADASVRLQLPFVPTSRPTFRGTVAPEFWSGEFRTTRSEFRPRLREY